MCNKCCYRSSRDTDRRRRRNCGIRWRICGHRANRMIELDYFDTFNLREAGVLGTRYD